MPLDHLVYAVPDLAAGMSEFSQRLGQDPQFGGRHEGLGTHNAIFPLKGEAYVELIARDPDAAQPSQPRPFGLDTLDRARLVTWAVRSRAIEIDIEHAHQAGLEFSPIIAMSRRPSSGEQLEWKLSLPTRTSADGLIPFVIDWGDTPHPAASPTSNGNAPELGDFSASHPEPDSIRSALESLGAELNVEQGPQSALTAEIRTREEVLVLR